MLTTFLIAFAAACGWLIKDKIHDGANYHLPDNWKKYVGCLVAGVLYRTLSGVKVFEYIAEIAVIALVANSFSDVITFLNWLLVRLKIKAKL